MAQEGADYTPGTQPGTSTPAGTTYPGTYKTAQEAAAALLGPGWTITGEKPEYEEHANPEYTGPTDITHPKTIKVVVGTTYSVKGPQGEVDRIVLNPQSTTGFTVREGPTKNAPGASTSPRATPAGGLERLDANLQPTTDPSKTVYVRDPAAPAGTQPFKIDAAGDLGDPSTWQPIYDPNDTSQVNRRVIGYYDPKAQKVAASVSAQGGNKPSDPVNWRPVYRRPGSPESGIVGQWDSVNNELHAVATVDGKQIVTTSNAIYVVDKDTGKTTKVQDIDKSVPYQLANVDGVAYRFDPNESDISKALVKLGPGQSMPKQIDQNGVKWTWNDEKGTYELPPGVTRPTTMTGAGTTSEWLIKYDAVTGDEISRSKNPNYQAPKETLPAINTTSPFIPAPDGKGGWTWVENKGQVVASDALKNMASILSGQVVEGKLGVDEAKEIISGANQSMQNAITAANTQLDFVSQGAQTGAGLLQKRADTAQGIMGQILGLAGQGQHYGGGGGTAGLSGGMMAAPAGIGNLITQGAAGYSAELLGGQATMDAAARLVQAADPKSSMFSPASQAAVATLSQMFDKYQQLNGQPHPAVAAQAAAQQSNAAGALVAPGTVPMTTQLQEASPWQRADQMYGNTPQGNALAPPGAAGTVPFTAPQYLGNQPMARAPEPQERSINFNPYSPAPFRAPGPVTSGAPTVNLYVGGGG